MFSFYVIQKVRDASEPLYNMVRYNMVLDITDQDWTPNGYLKPLFL